MSLLADLMTIMQNLEIPAETGVYKSTPAPDLFAVLVPMEQSFEISDDYPEFDVQNVRISLFSQGAYTATANNITRAVLAAGAVVTDRRYVGHEDDTDYHHYIIDTQKIQEWEEN